MEEQIKFSPGRFAVVKKVIIYGIPICFTLVFIVYLWACFDIRSGVKEISAEAVQQHPGERVEALIAYVKSENHSLRQRNLAVWALGRIGDRRALPVLKQYYTGGPCDHDNCLCQHELQKAIKLCQGSLNATAWLPR
jgi:hypothetical protein